MKQKPINSGVVVVTNAGGVGVVCIDLLAKYGLDLYQIDDQLKSTLTNILPASASIHNPIDILGDSKSDRYELVLGKLIRQHEINSILVIVTPQIMTDTTNIAKIIVKLSAENPKLPIIPIFIGGDLITSSLHFFQQQSYPVYETPEDAVESLQKYLEFNHKKADSSIKAADSKINKENPEIIQLNHEIKGNTSGSLDFLSVQKIAKLFDIPTAKFELIATAGVFNKDLAHKFLKKYPTIVIKVVSAGILHRSEQKMVEVDITSLDQIQSFYNRFKDQKPDIVVQEMITDGIQCFLGVNRDPQFGPILIVGTGGIYAEIMDDFVLIPLPASPKTIQTYLQKTKLYQVLNGARNQFWDIQSFTNTAYKLSQILDYFPGISSIDINPYIALEKNGKVVDFKVIVDSKTLKNL